MRRTQLYLDEEMARVLAMESHRRGTTVSELVRDAVAARYGPRRREDRQAIIDRVAGIWADRKDIGSTERQVRCLRRSHRLARWVGRGRAAEVPARHRRRH